jgi:hypothetical protein
MRWKRHAKVHGDHASLTVAATYFAKKACFTAPIPVQPELVENCLQHHEVCGIINSEMRQRRVKHSLVQEEFLSNDVLDAAPDENLLLKALSEIKLGLSLELRSLSVLGVLRPEEHYKKAIAEGKQTYHAKW